MAEPTTNCANCGAPTDPTISICVYCDTRTRSGPLTAEEQRHALLRYHQMLSELVSQPTDRSPGFDPVRMLQAGFVPAETGILIDAGLKMIPYIGDRGLNGIDDAAANRVEMIVRQLRIKTATGSSPEQAEAIRQLQAALDKHAGRRKKDIVFFLVALAIGLLVVGGLIYLILAAFN